MRRLTSLAAAALVAAPKLAGACPACARDGNNAAVAWMVGAMMLAPLVLGGVIFAVARRANADVQGGAP